MQPSRSSASSEISCPKAIHVLEQAEALNNRNRMNSISRTCSKINLVFGLPREFLETWLSDIEREEEPKKEMQQTTTNQRSPAQWPAEGLSIARAVSSKPLASALTGCDGGTGVGCC